MSIELRYTVFSPEGKGSAAEKAAPLRPLAGRLDSLENKTVYLVDTGFGGSSTFMIELQKWFSRNMPSVKTIRKRKPGDPFMDDKTELWEEIKAKGDAAVIGVGG